MKLVLFWLTTSAFLPAIAQHANHYPLIAIRDVTSTKADTFRIKATVESIYVCPPCPKGAMCKPCIGNHIIAINGKDSTRTWLRVFTDRPDQFVVQKKYIFTLALRNKVRHDDATLVGFDPVEK